MPYAPKPENHLSNVCMKCWKKVLGRNIRQRALDMFQNECARCGFADPRALHIDHKNGGGAKERKQLGGPNKMYRRVLTFPEEYQILCANCNVIKRAEDKERTGACHHDEDQTLDQTVRGYTTLKSWDNLESY